FAIRHVADEIVRAGAEVRAMRVCGGPARSETWNQIKADVTGFPVEVPAVLETAVTGAAIVAATAVGAWPDLPAAIHGMTRVARRPRGEITLGGDAIAGPAPRIGLVFQEPRLLPWRSVADNVAWPLELAGWGQDRAAARVGELLGLVDLVGATDLRPVQLSGG